MAPSCLNLWADRRAAESTAVPELPKSHEGLHETPLCEILGLVVLAGKPRHQREQRPLVREDQLLERLCIASLGPLYEPLVGHHHAVAPLLRLIPRSHSRSSGLV